MAKTPSFPTHNRIQLVGLVRSTKLVELGKTGRKIFQFSLCTRKITPSINVEKGLIKDLDIHICMISGDKALRYVAARIRKGVVLMVEGHVSYFERPLVGAPNNTLRFTDIVVEYWQLLQEGDKDVEHRVQIVGEPERFVGDQKRYDGEWDERLARRNMDEEGGEG